MSKGANLIPEIISARTNNDAVKVLKNVLSALYLTNSYTELVKIKDDLAEEEERFRTITDGYEKSEKELPDMLNTRLALTFLYRDVSDKFSFNINSKKIYFEEMKTSQRAESMKNLRHNDDVQKTFKATSASALRDIVGLDDEYKEYITNASISYGLYQQLGNFLNGIRQFVDYLASAIKTEQQIKQQDAK